MIESPALSLVHNASLLLAMALVYDVLAGKSAPLSHQARRQVLLGLLVGAIGMAVMLTPWQYVPGVAFDTRSVLLGVTGLFFGWIPTVIAMAMTAALRLYQGGLATGAGVAVIVASGCLGLAWRRWHRGALEDISFPSLYVLGITIHVTMLALMFLLPREMALRVLAAITLPVLVIYPFATALLGALLSARLRRHRLGGRLVESEERLRLALAAANQGLWDLDIRTGEVIVSTEYATMLGYDPAGFRETSASWNQRVHPEDHERVAGIYRDYVAGAIPEYRVEFRLRMQDGGWLWVLSQGSIVARDAAGAPLRMLGTNTDITGRRKSEQHLREAQAEAQRLLAESDQSRLALLSVVEDLKAAEEKLGRSEAFYRSLFENMHEGFAYCRMVYEDGEPRDFVYLRVNESFLRMRGLSRVEGRAASEVIPGIRDSNPELLENYGRVAASGNPEIFEVNIARLERWYLVSVFSPEKDHFVAAFTDITQRKEAELENERRLAELKRWHEVTLDREERVMQLKAEVNELRRRLGEAPRFGLPGPAPQPPGGGP
ncbi:MAG TPA: LytS/YhcK type 5TM receptor domain-containing protein [Usitatibacteraceae bacterium]|nr:LytS/YhcK type 5TM receptor domain-containing protein [Usitatibacteraceae bacterium]